MAETIVKVDNYTVEIQPPPVAVAPIRKSLKVLRNELAQARASKAAIQTRHAEELVPIQETIDTLKARVDSAILLIQENNAE